MGFGVLWTWNAILNCFDYFIQTFEEPVLSFAYPWVFSLPWIFFQTVIFCFGFRISYTYRMVFTFSFSAVLLLLMVLVCFTFQGSTGFWLVGIILFFMGANTSVLNASSMGLASLLPPEYIGAFTLGMGLAGVGASTLKVITQLSVHNLSASFLTFMVVSALVSLVCIGSVLYIEHNEFANYYFSASSSPASPTYSPKLTEKLLPGIDQKLSKQKQTWIASPSSFSMSKVINRTKRNIEQRRQMQRKFEAQREEFNLNFSEPQEKPRPPRIQLPSKEAYGAKVELHHVLKQTWSHLVVIFLIVFQAFYIFPAGFITAKHKELDQSWTVIIHIFAYNYCFVVGRLLINFGILEFRWHILIVALRFVYFWVVPQQLMTCPLYDDCVGEVCYSQHEVFGQLWFRLIVTCSYAILHGYSFTCVAMQAPGTLKYKVEDQESELEMVGHLVSCAFTLAIFLGLFASHFVFMDFTPSDFCIVT